MLRSKTAAGHLAALLTILIWGTTFVATKVLLDSFSPIEILFSRFTIGYLALLLMHPKRLVSGGIRQELLLAGAGLFGVTLYFLMENIALTYTYASNVGVITSIAPIMIALLAFWLLGEKLRLRFVGGFLLAIGGIALMSFYGSAQLQTNPLGDLLALLSTLAWAVYSILMRKTGQLGYHVVACTRRIFLYGILFMIPALFFLETSTEWQRYVVPANWLNLLYLGVGASALCFVTWNWAVQHLGPVKTGVYIYGIPIVSVVASAIVLGEKITWSSGVGTGLILLGVLLSEGNFSRWMAPREGGTEGGTGGKKVG